MSARSTFLLHPQWKAKLPVEGEPGKTRAVLHYIDVETGQPTTDRSRALVQRFHASPTMGERLRIERIEHAILGGISDHAEFMADLAEQEEFARRALSAQLWPKGVADLADPEAVQALDEAFETWEHPARSAIMDMRYILARVRMMAVWEILVVEPEPGWAKLRERTMSDVALDQLMVAWTKATSAETAGNA